MIDKGYNIFVNNSFNKFQIDHLRLCDNYMINDYGNWYYQQVTELLTLTDAKLGELNFKYTPIGTFSRTSETWMWSWFNEYSIEHSKLDLDILIQLGQKKSYPKLTEGTFPSHKDEGWEFTAMAHHKLGGLGGYRVETDQLIKFFLLERIVEQEEVEVRKNQVVICKAHDEGRVAFVCCHLQQRNNAGFEEAFESSDKMKLDFDDNFQAWCSKCEIERLKTDGWDEKSMKYANIQIVCETCYFIIKESALNDRSYN